MFGCFGGSEPPPGAESSKSLKQSIVVLRREIEHYEHEHHEAEANAQKAKRRTSFYTSGITGAVSTHELHKSDAERSQLTLDAKKRALASLYLRFHEREAWEKRNPTDSLLASCGCLDMGGDGGAEDMDGYLSTEPPRRNSRDAHRAPPPRATHPERQPHHSPPSDHARKPQRPKEEQSPAWQPKAPPPSDGWTREQSADHETFYYHPATSRVSLTDPRLAGLDDHHPAGPPPGRGRSRSGARAPSSARFADFVPSGGDAVTPASLSEGLQRFGIDAGREPSYELFSSYDVHLRGHLSEAEFAPLLQSICAGELDHLHREPGGGDGIKDPGGFVGAPPDGWVHKRSLDGGDYFEFTTTGEISVKRPTAGARKLQRRGSDFDRLSAHLDHVA